MFLAKTLRISCLAFRSGGISSTLSRAALTSSSPCIRSTSGSSTPRMSGTAANGGVVGPLNGKWNVPRVPVSSITAFGQGLGQDELQVWLRTIFASC